MFELDRIAVPFRMQPGLRKLPARACQLTPLVQGSPLWLEKRAVLQAGEAPLSVPGFDPGPALRAILQHAREHGLPTPGQQLAPGLPPALAFEEDFAVLEAGGGTLPWLCVCVPSHWAPEDKLGLSLAAVHAPVADAQMLVAASEHLVRLVTSGEAWERFVWTITPSGRHDQHPRRHAREPWPEATDADEFARRCWLRSERQTFLPVAGAPGQAVFTIRVMLQRLAEAVDSQPGAARLHDAIASMSAAVLAYKGLAPARAPLLRWLAARMN